MLLTSDAGLLPIRQLDETLQLTQQLTAALDDSRRQKSVQHSFIEMVRSRIYGILADYPDQNDHEVLRCDPLFKMIAGQSPDSEKHLACQATLSRFENGITVSSLKQLEDVFIEQFIDSFDEPPSTLTFDVDAFDDPVDKTIEGIPPEAQSEYVRRGYQNRRRQRDPLGEGQPCTWRSRLIKVAALIEVSCRRIIVRLPRHWLYLAHLEKFCTVAMSFSTTGRSPD